MYSEEYTCVFLLFFNYQGQREGAAVSGTTVYSCCYEEEEEEEEEEGEFQGKMPV